ncbi:hypothetical protein [Ekhidna sp.]|uniref:hypothetical protein n=1 Tax=Ekhidna sp. TaxID=2608089 RepID=UPI003B5BE86D
MKTELAQNDIGKYKSCKYRIAFKLKVIDDLIANQESDTFISRKHGIPSGSLWSIKRDLLNRLGYYPILDQVTKKQQQGKLTSEEEVEALKKALDLATMKVAALETLIDVAEDQFNIDIRKKPESKQSK